MKELGYPHMISMESFRSPNFDFIANCLYWLMLRYDPTIDLEKNISTEADRINFVKSATKLMLARAKIKLNPKHIYSADGYAVKELLKIATILNTATKRAVGFKSELIIDNVEVATVVKPCSAKASRIIVNEITKCGTTLYDSLEAEPNFKKQRDQTLLENPNVDEVEFNMREAIETMMTKIIQVNQEICQAEDTQKILHSKCEKRKLELEHSQKRLSTLQNVKPTYMNQYDEMQVHLRSLFSQYIEKFQNLKWLETQVETYSSEKQEKLDEVDCRMRRLQKTIQNEETCSFQSEDANNDLVKNMENPEESEGERANIWNWFHDRISITKKENNLKALNMIANEIPYNLQVPLSQSNWKVYKLDEHAQKLPFDKSNKEHLANKHCENLKSTTFEHIVTNSHEMSLSDYKESKVGKEELEDDLLDIDASTCDEGLDEDTSSNEF